MTRYIGILLGLLWLAAPARAEYFVIDNYRVDIRVLQSGEFEVTETIDVTFSSQRHGIFRIIPIRYKLDGKTHKIKISGVKVEGWPVEKSWEWDYLNLRLGNPDRYVIGPQRYVIRYKVRNAWIFAEEHTEFYWNMTGNRWDVPMGKVEYRIEFEGSPELTEADYYVYTGYQGAQESDATIHYRGGAVGGQSLRAFNPGEGLTVAVRLPVDYIRRPTQSELFIKNYGLLGVPIALFALLMSLWYRHGRDEKRSLMAQYYPPDGITPAEAGGFIDDKIDNRDLICLIPYWGGQGYLEMEEIEKKNLIFKSRDYRFIRKNALPATRPAYEITLFTGLFPHGEDDVLLSSLKDSFYKWMASARTQLKHTILDKQLYTPGSRRIYDLLPLGAILAGVLVVLFFFLEQWPAAIGMAVLALTTILMRRPMLKRSTKGSDVYEHLRGFREFIERADKPRLELLLKDDPTYFDRTLPYAIAFNMAKKWASKFDGLFTEPPRWYRSHYPGGIYHASHFGSFADNFSSSMQEVQSAFTSQPSSSGSGGSFGGGGFSGGGFGGGGGGSW